MKIKIKRPDPNDTQVIKPRRVYHCAQDNRLMMRSEVSKDHNGNFHCSFCGGLVEDVTDTVTGHDFMEVMGI